MGHWPATLSKKRLQHKCFHVNIEKFLRTAYYRIPPVAASNFIMLLNLLLDNVPSRHLPAQSKQ